MIASSPGRSAQCRCQLSCSRTPTHLRGIARDGHDSAARLRTVGPRTRGGAARSTEDIQHFTRLTSIVAGRMFPGGGSEIAQTPDALATSLRGARAAVLRSQHGNRLSGTGEHVVVLRPTPGRDAPDRPAHLHTDAVLEVYVRQGTGQSGPNSMSSRSRDRRGAGMSDGAFLTHANLTPLMRHPVPSGATSAVWRRSRSSGSSWPGCSAGSSTPAPRGTKQSDRADIREWVDNTRIFRKTLAELVKEYVDLLRDAGPRRGPRETAEVQARRDR